MGSVKSCQRKLSDLEGLELGHGELSREHTLSREVSDKPQEEVMLLRGDARQLGHDLRKRIEGHNLRNIIEGL